MRSPIRQLICLGICAAFLVTSLPASFVYANDIALPKPGTMVHLSRFFSPAILKGIKVHPDNPFKFEFVLDVGNGRDHSLQDESTKLIKYFLASLTIPEEDLWVNLSPYEKDRIVPEAFGKTEMGRDLLAQDYILKQITASLMYPEGAIGKKFWKSVYEEVFKKFGATNVPVSTFNKVWIVPEKAVVYENAKAGTAYVVESKLKVMLEEDYLALSHAVIPAEAGIHSKMDPRLSPAGTASLKHSGVTSGIIREIVIPALTREVNEGKNFAQLRQVYNSLILATWYKKKIKESILNQVYSDRNKIAGVNIADPQEKQRIYEQYLQAFKKGAYNFIKEEQDPISQQMIPRKYFSGGMKIGMSRAMIVVNKAPNRLLSNIPGSKFLRLVTLGLALCSGAACTTREFSGGVVNEEMSQYNSNEQRVIMLLDKAKGTLETDAKTALFELVHFDPKGINNSVLLMRLHALGNPHAVGQLKIFIDQGKYEAAREYIYNMQLGNNEDAYRKKSAVIIIAAINTRQYEDHWQYVDTKLDEYPDDKAFENIAIVKAYTGSISVAMGLIRRKVAFDISKIYGFFDGNPRDIMLFGAYVAYGAKADIIQLILDHIFSGKDTTNIQYLIFTISSSEKDKFKRALALPRYRNAEIPQDAWSVKLLADLGLPKAVAALRHLPVVNENPQGDDIRMRAQSFTDSELAAYVKTHSPKPTKQIFNSLNGKRITIRIMQYYLNAGFSFDEVLGAYMTSTGLPFENLIRWLPVVDPLSQHFSRLDFELAQSHFDRGEQFQREKFLLLVKMLVSGHPQAGKLLGSHIQGNWDLLGELLDLKILLSWVLTLQHTLKNML